MKRVLISLAFFLATFAPPAAHADMPANWSKPIRPSRTSS